MSTALQRSFKTSASDIELLSDRHLAYLRNRGVSDEIIVKRGYSTVTRSRDLPPLKSGEWSRALRDRLDEDDNTALVIPLFLAYGSEPSTYQVRLDRPREEVEASASYSRSPKVKSIKFELPTGIQRGINPGDIPADISPVLDEPHAKHTTFVITEGTCKADALLSAALRFGKAITPIALTGVWMGLHGPETEGNLSRNDILTATLDELSFNGREVILAWDADAATNQSVAAALVRTATLLEATGADVSILVPGPINGDRKTGIDDYLATFTSEADFQRLLDLREDISRFRLIAKDYTDSDSGRGKRLADEMVRQGTFRFLPRKNARGIGEGSFFRFDGARLTQDRALEEATELARELTARDSDRASNQSLTRITNAVRSSTVSAALGIRAEDLDSQTDVLATGTGQLIDLRTGTVRATTAADCVTKTTTYGLDYELATPLWNKFLGDITVGDKELESFLQYLFGMILLGRVSEEKLVILFGKGKNGKSTLMEIVTKVLGRELSVVLRGDKLGAEMADDVLASLRGARLAMGDDSLGDDIRASTIKRLSSKDSLKGRHLYQDAVEFEPSHTPVLFANKLPRIDHVNEAIWRRVVVVPFLMQVTEKKANLANRILEKEAEGILAWMVKGTKLFIENGEELPACAAVDGLTKKYRDDEDYVRAWFEARCTTDASDRETGATLLGDLNEWVLAEYGFTPTKTPRKLRSELDAIAGVSIGDVKSGKRYWTGIGLKAV